MKRVVAGMFSPQRGPADLATTIWWWEVRRIPFNLVVGIYGMACLAIHALALTASGRLGPGEDVVEPVVLLAAPIAINALYTLGWMVEAPLRSMCPSLGRAFGPRLLGTGLALGLMLATIPVAAWAAILIFE